MANSDDLHYPGFTYGEDYTVRYSKEVVRDLEDIFQAIVDRNYHKYKSEAEAKRHTYFEILDYVYCWCDPNLSNLDKLVSVDIDFQRVYQHKTPEEIGAFEDAIQMYFLKSIVEGIAGEYDWFVLDGSAPKLEWMYESILKNDTAPVVLCNLNHTIVYMNPAAEKNYEKKITAYVGGNLMDCHNEHSKEMIIKIIDWFKKSPDNNIVHTFYDEKKQKDVYMIALRDGDKNLIGYYEKHEYRNRDESPFYVID